MANNPVVMCTIFTCKAAVTHHREITFSLITDLPIGTLVGVMFTREYRDIDKSRSVWVGFWESYNVDELDNDRCGFNGSCLVDSSDKLGATWFKNAHKSISSTISEPVSDKITIVFTVGGRQRVKYFGKGNKHLAGVDVIKDGDDNIIEKHVILTCPMSTIYQPKIT